jgi:hypothetical protein
MRLQHIVYPDVYCIPLWLGASCHYLANGTRVPRNKYDFIFSELNGSVGELQYLADVIDAHRERVIVLPGPPEVFLANANEAAQRLARDILRTTRHVLAYSNHVASFADSLAEAHVAKTIPWPFDYASTLHFVKQRKASSEDHIHILMGAPLRFKGIAENAPDLLEECIAQALAEMPESKRMRFKFHGFVYTNEDKAIWHKTQFGRRIGAVLEPKRSYTSFLRFVGKCDAVLQLSRFGILGRLTFVAGALGKPGIFSTNVELNKRLYPFGQVNDPYDKALRGNVRELLHGLVRGNGDARFLPDDDAARSVGDYYENAAKVRELLRRS